MTCYDPTNAVTNRIKVFSLDDDWKCITRNSNIVISSSSNSCCCRINHQNQYWKLNLSALNNRSSSFPTTSQALVLYANGKTNALKNRLHYPCRAFPVLQPQRKQKCRIIFWPLLVLLISTYSSLLSSTRSLVVHGMIISTTTPTNPNLTNNRSNNSHSNSFDPSQKQNPQQYTQSASSTMSSNSGNSNDDTSNNSNIHDTINEPGHSNESLSSISSLSCSAPTKPFVGQKVHVIVLVHGWMGNAKELFYLEQRIQKLVAMDSAKNHQNVDPSIAKFIVHSSVCNTGLTFDGIAAGGTRLANEVNQILEPLLFQQKQLQEQSQKDQCDTERSSSIPSQISLSLVGNSLGGLYARYAVSKIDYIRNGDVVPAVFCTLVTPHLGIRENTYVPLPYVIEKVIAATLKQTGMDLFRETYLLDEMVLDDAFVAPLRLFHNRRLYANAYHTDFQVPFRTSAFMSNTDSVHYNRNGTDITDDQRQKFVAVIVETEKQQHTASNLKESDGRLVCSGTPASDDHDYESLYGCAGQNVAVDGTARTQEPSPKEIMTLDEMAVRLDAMGWTKVICDTRSELFTLPNPFSRSFWSPLASRNDDKQYSRTFSQKETSGLSSNDNDGKTQHPKQNNPRQMEDQKLNIHPNSFTSSELLNKYSSNVGTNREDKWHIPFGHSVLVANSKTEWYGEFNAGGRPLVNLIAADILREINKLSQSIE